MSARTAAVFLLLVAVAYAALVASFWNHGYIDFGDGNYMYISWRLSQGAVLYRDILAPQPPMHLLAGHMLAWAGERTGYRVEAFRAFSLLLRLATMLLVYAVAVRVAAGPARVNRPRGRPAGLVAAVTYLILPLGFWWSQGYQSEPLEMFFLLASLLCFLSWRTHGMVWAGFLAAFAPLTNMTAAPYVLFTAFYLLVRRPRLAAAFVLPMCVVIGITVVIMETLTGAYLENVIFNQVGSFPRSELLPPGETLFTYAWRKILQEGWDVLQLQGGFIVLSLAGLAAYSRRGAPDDREYVTWYTFFMFCSIVYVSKGGTMDYIFTIAEPLLAVFVGYAAFELLGLSGGAQGARFSLRNTAPAAGLAVLLLAALCLLAPGMLHSWSTLKQRTYELDEDGALRIAEQIRNATKPDELVLAPPYYAYLARRRIAEDFSEIFLWMLKYHNEKQDRQEERGVKTVRRLGELLSQKKIRYVVLDLGQMGNIPETSAPLAANYRALRREEYRTLNTRLQFYEPLGSGR